MRDAKEVLRNHIVYAIRQLKDEPEKETYLFYRLSAMNYSYFIIDAISFHDYIFYGNIINKATINNHFRDNTNDR